MNSTQFFWGATSDESAPPSTAQTAERMADHNCRTSSHLARRGRVTARNVRQFMKTSIPAILEQQIEISGPIAPKASSGADEFNKPGGNDSDNQQVWLVEKETG